MRVSLTTFIDFTAANGPSRTRVVSKAKKETADYEPAADFYRGIRNPIIETLQYDLDRDTIRESAAIAHSPRVSHYTLCADGFLKWWGRKSIVWIEKPALEIWTSGDLEVRRNPELYIDVNGESHLIKLYFKADPISKRRIDATLYLLGDMRLSREVDKVGVLDVRRGKIFTPTIHRPNLAAYLAGEAAAFAAMWDALP